MRLLERLGLHRPELRAWAMYDWANSAFQTTVITAVFPRFFADYAAAGLSATAATQRFAWAATHRRRHRRCPRSGARSDCRLPRRQEAVACAVAHHRRGRDRHDGRHHAGRVAVRGGRLHRRQHRDCGQSGLLRLAAPASRVARGAGSRLNRRLRDRICRRWRAAGGQSGVDPVAHRRSDSPTRRRRRSCHS